MKKLLRLWCWIRFRHQWVWKRFHYNEEGVPSSAIFRCRTCHKRIHSDFEYINGRKEMPIGIARRMSIEAPPTAFRKTNHNGVDYE